MTSKIERLFEQNPPLRPINDLDSLVDDWIYRFGNDGLSKHMRDDVVDYCAAADSLDTAIDRACASLRRNGKLHNHQSRVRADVRKYFAHKIKTEIETVTFNNFDELHDWLEEIKPRGIGEVTTYDVATRVGAYMQLEPTSLYLHAHVRVGWNKLHGTRRVPEDNGRVPKEMLPQPLHRIPADQVEDMLCCYCEVIKPWLKK